MEGTARDDEIVNSWQGLPKSGGFCKENLDGGRGEGVQLLLGWEFCSAGDSLRRVSPQLT